MKNTKAPIVYVESKAQAGVFLYYREFRAGQDADAQAEAAALALKGTRALVSDSYAPSITVPVLPR